MEQKAVASTRTGLRQAVDILLIVLGTALFIWLGREALGQMADTAYTQGINKNIPSDGRALTALLNQKPVVDMAAAENATAVAESTGASEEKHSSEKQPVPSSKKREPDSKVKDIEGLINGHAKDNKYLKPGNTISL